MNYVEEVLPLAMRLAGAISQGLALGTGRNAERAFGEASDIFACIVYPPYPETQQAPGLASHGDRGGITAVVMENALEGLQVQRQEKCVLVLQLPGSFMVNVKRLT